jgi:membrane fusion protein (multidrug efflux system)
MNALTDIQARDFAAAPKPAARSPRALRKRLFAGLAGVVLITAGGFGGYQWMVASHYASTDNAYVGAESAQVTSRIEGAVTEVRVSDTQRVAAGDVLVVLDDADAKLGVEQAEAALAQSERRVMGWMANDRALAAQTAARAADQARADAQVTAAESDLGRAKQELGRRQALAATGAVAGEELTRAENALRQADAALAQARAARRQAAATKDAAAASLEVNHLLVEGAGVADNPEVAAARERLAQAELALQRTVIRSPLAGVVTSRRVQVGQRIQPGAALMTVVPVAELYVDANFKEGQLARVRAGQPVELTSDLYGEGVTFHGHVEGLSGGTGAAFALIPAQNATGNWIKVVQRVPVRIRLKPDELHAHPLRVGLSMTAKVHLIG